MNEIIRGQDINGANILHAIPVEADRWHGVDFQRAVGICVYNREQLITRIADMIGEGYIYALDVASWRGYIDRAGNIWMDHEYLAPYQYLPRLITP